MVNYLKYISEAFNLLNYILPSKIYKWYIISLLNLNLFYMEDILTTLYFFRKPSRGNAWCTEWRTCKERSVPTKTPLFSRNMVTSRKSKKLWTKAVNETMLPMRRRKTITISHTQQRTTPISTPISTKEKEWGHEKKGDPHQEQEKVNKGKK